MQENSNKLPRRKFTQEELEMRLTVLNEQTAEQQSLWNKLSGARFAAALALIISVIGAAAQGWPWLWLVAIFALVLTVLAFRSSASVGREIRLNRARSEVVSEYLARLTGDYSGLTPFELPAAAAEAFDGNTIRTWEDLGLLGADGLFTYLQCLEAPGSGKPLIDAFVPEPHMEQAEDRRILVQGVLLDPGFGPELQAQGRVSSDRVHEDPSEDRARQLKGKRGDVETRIWSAVPAIRILQQVPPAKKGWQRFIDSIGRWVLPAVSLGGFALLVMTTFISAIPVQWGLAVIAVSGAVNWGLYLVRSRDIAADLDPLAHARSEILQAAGVFRFLENYELPPETDPDHSRALRNKLSVYRDAQSAGDALKRLDSLTQAALLRNQGIIHLFAVMWLGWDLHVWAKFSEWRNSYGHSLEAWYKAWAELDVANSLAVIPRVSDTWCWGEALEYSPNEGPMIQAKAMRHPLIVDEEAAANDFAAADETVVITGSNMSGKSTFLRTLGIATLLAQAGSPVPAASFRWQPLRILSSIRTQDRLSEGISAFYAEVLRIRSMKEEVETREPAMLLIDEIFHGTNSADRVYGAEQALRKLSGANTLVLVTTHDFALCDLEDDPQIRARNMHFNEFYDEAGMHFDYQIKKGRSNTTNARYLLELAGLV